MKKYNIKINLMKKYNVKINLKKYNFKYYSNI